MGKTFEIVLALEIYIEVNRSELLEPDEVLSIVEALHYSYDPENAALFLVRLTSRLPIDVGRVVLQTALNLVGMIHDSGTLAKCFGRLQFVMQAFPETKAQFTALIELLPSPALKDRQQATSLLLSPWSKINLSNMEVILLQSFWEHKYMI